MNKKISSGSGVQIICAVFLPFGVGYYLSYFFRTINAVISENLSTELGLGPANLGLLTSFYLIAFACAQIPLGIALDRYGPRTVNGFLLMIAGVGATIFAFAQSFETLLLGRALIGLGVSAALVSACKANAIWFSADRIPLMNNLIGAFGALGALSATRPVELILQVVSWRDIFGYLAVTTVLIALVILTLVPEKREARPVQQNASEQLESYKNIICDRYFWRVSLMYAFSGAAFVSYQTLWADPWLRDVAGLEQAERANYLLAIQAGFLLGLLITGMVADLLRKTRYQAVHVFGGGVFLLIGVQVLLAFGITSGLFAIWFLYGLLSSATFLAYAAQTAHFSDDVSGRAMTAMNFLMFALAFFCQWGIGEVIESFPADVHGRYSLAAHATALWIIIGAQSLCILYFIFPGQSKSKNV